MEKESRDSGSVKFNSSSVTPKPAPRPTAGLVSVASWCAYVSGYVSMLGIAFLFAFFVLGAPTGRLNDIAVIVQYSLMLPIALALYRVLRSHNPSLSLAALLIGIPGMLAVIVLQILLVTGVLPFANQIVPVVIAFLVVLIWFIINGYLGRSTNKLPNRMLLHVLAGLYVGYPFWAFSVGRRLRSPSQDLQPLDPTGRS